MSRQILISLFNCSWQWGLLSGLTWLVTSRLRRANTTFHLLWLLSLISLPILFGLNQLVPGISIKAAQSELTQAQPVAITALILQTADLLDLPAVGNQALSVNHILTDRIFPANWGLLDGLLCAWAIGVLICWRVYCLACTASVTCGELPRSLMVRIRRCAGERLNR